MRSGTSGLAVVLSLSLSVQAFALPPDVQKRADDTFQEGRDAMEKGDFRKALEVLWTSHELDPKRGKLLNIAVCEEHLGKVASALAHIQEVDPQIPTDDPRRPTVDTYLAKLPARIPYLRIDLAPGAPPDASVTLDGEPVAKSKWGTDMPLDPGKYVVLVAAPGRPERRYEVTLEEGKRAPLSVEVQPDVAPSSPNTAVGVAPTASVAPMASATVAVPVEGGKRSLAPTVLLGGAGAIGVGAGIVFAVMRGGKQEEASRLRAQIDTDQRYCNPKLVDTFDSDRCPMLANTTRTGDAFGTASVVSFIVGGLAAVGAVMYAAWPTRKQDAPPRVSFRLVPVIGAQEQGATVVGSF